MDEWMYKLINQSINQTINQSINTDMMLTLPCTKSSSSSLLFYISNLQFIYFFIHLFESGN